MIIGTGIDLVDLNRLSQIATDRFINRILSDAEKKMYHNIEAPITKLSFLGGRFAAKEALFKAIKSGHGKTYYKDFSILNRPDGSPYVETDYFKANEVLHITITHTDQHAICHVIIEKP
jgi:holo-[acyl-carrier protein] synthase